MAAAARKATMSAFAITQMMPSCKAVQTQLLSFYICQQLVDRHLEKYTCAGRLGFFLHKSHPLGLGATLEAA